MISVKINTLYLKIRDCFRNTKSSKHAKFRDGSTARPGCPNQYPQERVDLMMPNRTDRMRGGRGASLHQWPAPSPDTRKAGRQPRAKLAR